MPVIEKAHETMSSRERVLKTFNFEKTDRVPIGYEANPGINKRLCEAVGASSDSELLDALGVDYHGIRATYIGPRLFADVPDRNVNPLHGYRTQWITHQTGGYWDICDFPLKDATDEMFNTYPIPSPDDFDYEQTALEAKVYRRYALFVGGAGSPDIINSNG